MISLLDHYKIKRTQREVDFLIPFLDMDRRYFLDPSLLRFSGRKMFKLWDQEINDFLALIHSVIKKRDHHKLKRLLQIGEAGDAGFGYCRDGVNGSGVGGEIASNVALILSKNQEFIERGFYRIEELQWLDINIGPDRISDLVINILKRHIIEYTQQQSKLHGIPMEPVRVDMVFYPDLMEWGPITAELPVNPFRFSRNAVNAHPGELLLPKECLKTLPLFLSYDSFHGYVDPEGKRNTRQVMRIKPIIVSKAIENPKISERYIRHREAQRETLVRPDFDNQIISAVEGLDQIKKGREQADEYRRIIADILNFLFEELELLGQEKVSFNKDIRRDIIFVNNGKSEILKILREKHGATHIVVDAKNTDHVTPDDISRVADYLNDDIGRVGIIVAHKIDKKVTKHQYSQLKDHKKVILFFSNEELKRLVTLNTRINHISEEKLHRGNILRALYKKYSELVTL